MWKIWLALPKGRLPLCMCVWAEYKACWISLNAHRRSRQWKALCEGWLFTVLSGGEEHTYCECCDHFFTVVIFSSHSMTFNAVPHSSSEVSPENTQRWVSRQICSRRAFAGWVLLSRLNTQQDKQTEPSFPNTAYKRPRPEQDWSVNLQERHIAALW